MALLCFGWFIEMVDSALKDERLNPPYTLQEFDLAGDALPYVKIAWMKIYKHA